VNAAPARWLGADVSLVDLSSEWRALSEWTADTCGLVLGTGQVDQLRAYLDTLLLWNRKLALVSQRDPVEIMRKHFADSLFAASFCIDGEPVVDLGSGAGFPGLPIAVARPTSRVCLIEARGKKVSFLEAARRAASVRNATVHHARIESIAGEPEHHQRYVASTARALTSTDQLLALARPLLTPGGRLIAMRSVNEGEDKDPPGAEVVRYELPDRTPRRLLIVRI
jgi:16S rRNA (guanine527-N7)-methyltransferase